MNFTLVLSQLTRCSKFEFLVYLHQTAWCNHFWSEILTVHFHLINYLAGQRLEREARKILVGKTLVSQLAGN